MKKRKISDYLIIIGILFIIGIIYYVFKMKILNEQRDSLTILMTVRNSLIYSSILTILQSIIYIPFFKIIKKYNFKRITKILITVFVTILLTNIIIILIIWLFIPKVE